MVLQTCRHLNHLNLHRCRQDGLKSCWTLIFQAKTFQVHWSNIPREPPSATQRIFAQTFVEECQTVLPSPLSKRISLATVGVRSVTPKVVPHPQVATRTLDDSTAVSRSLTRYPLDPLPTCHLSLPLVTPPLLRHLCQHGTTSSHHRSP